MTVDEYAKTLPTVKEFSTATNKEDGAVMNVNLTTRQKISLNYGDSVAKMKEMVLMSLRCSSDSQLIFNQLCADMKGFDKGYLLSYIITTGLNILGYTEKNVTQETRENFYKKKK